MRVAAILVLLAALPAFAARGLPAPVQKALHDAGVPLAGVSALVEPVEGGNPRLAYQERVAMNPASVMKLVTSFAALDRLGPAFRFHTEVFLAGEITDGVLDGDLVIRGGGDPKLTYERLWQLAHALRSRGLREIHGDIVIDRSYFAPSAYDPGRFDNEPHRGYNVGPDAFLVNFQAVQFSFVPDGDAARVVAEPDLPNVEIASRVRLTPEPCGWWRRNIQYDVQQNGMLALVTFSGSMGADCGEKIFTLSVLDPAAYTESVLRWVWSEAGGKLTGKVRAGTKPADAKLFYRAESDPLAVLVRDMDKYSNNVMARNLFLALSAEKSGGGGTTEASAAIVREWLAARGIDASRFSVENGAGLSRDDRVDAAMLGSLLRAAWASPVMPELVSALPIFAVDGTLEMRPATPVTGHAHLKGGTLNGVQGAAGYVIDARGKRWIVVMLVNHPNANAAQPAIDALVQWVYEGMH